MERLKRVVRDNFSGVANMLRKLRYGPVRGHQIQYLLDELTELRALTREMAAAINFDRNAAQTKDSFSHQWGNLKHSKHMIGDPVFERNMLGLVETYTGLPISFFAGKTILDAGCGNGRWSRAFYAMGAHVTAIDQSIIGIAELSEAARASNLRIEMHVMDILAAPLFPGVFDFVWSFGVTHHTGNTRRAVDHVASAVKPGGSIYVMIYGPPINRSEFIVTNKYGRLRRETQFMNFEEKTAYLRKRFPEDEVHGWFDAISPAINDLHTFAEIRGWLTELGFKNIRRTVDTQHNHIVADKA